jgi:hypothetical protein
MEKKPLTENPRRSETEKALAPVARFLGHSFAAAIGFAGLALISLIPIGVIHAIKAWGDAELAGSLRWLELTLLTVDIGLFMTVFVAGAVIFAAEMYVETEARIMAVFHRRKK